MHIDIPVSFRSSLVALLIALAGALPAAAQSSVGGAGAPATQAPTAPGGSEAVIAKIESAIAELQACNDQLKDLLAAKPQPPRKSTDPAAKSKYEQALSKWHEQVEKAQACTKKAQAKVRAAENAQASARAKDARQVNAHKTMNSEKRALDNTVRALKASAK